MKKHFYTMLLLAVAGMTTTAFVSCEEKEDVIEQKVEPKEDYLGIVYWVTNDVLEVADVKVSGISSLKFNTALSLEGCPGKICDVVELTGQQAKDADIKVTVELKPNWKELIKGKEVFNLGDVDLISNEKGKTFDYKNLNAHISVLDNNNHAGVTMEEAIESLVPGMGFEYKANK